jgi:hypothetical protein
VAARQVGKYGGLTPSLLWELLVDLLHHAEEALAANNNKKLTALTLTLTIRVQNEKSIPLSPHHPRAISEYQVYNLSSPATQ